jgi:hypothetical protein
MIDWLVNRIFRWDTLRQAVFDEVNLYQSITKRIWEMENLNPTNLTWAEEETGLWKGWTYSSEKKRYYFDDIGSESLMEFWETQWVWEEKDVSR